MDKQRLLEHIQGFPDGYCFACIMWTPPDVIDLGRRKGYELTLDRANEILEDMDHHADCSIGMTWDTVEYYVDEYVRQHKGELTTCEPADEEG